MYDINQIAEHAYNLAPKEYNKIELYQLTLEAIKNGGHLTEHQVAKLYRAFTPKHPAKPKTQEQWVWQAVAVKDVRLYLNFAYSDGSRLIGTDGHRMHVWKTNKYAPGYYDKNMIRVHETSWNRYPEIDRVVPDEKKLTVTVYKSDFEIIHTGDAKRPYPVMKHDDIACDASYMESACSGLTEPKIMYNEPTNALLVIDNAANNHFAVVMPRRI